MKNARVDFHLTLHNIKFPPEWFRKHAKFITSDRISDIRAELVKAAFFLFKRPLRIEMPPSRGEGERIAKNIEFRRKFVVVSLGYFENDKTKVKGKKHESSLKWRKFFSIWDILKKDQFMIGWRFLQTHITFTCTHPLFITQNFVFDHTFYFLFLKLFTK